MGKNNIECFYCETKKILDWMGILIEHWWPYCWDKINQIWPIKSEVMMRVQINIGMELWFLVNFIFHSLSNNYWFWIGTITVFVLEIGAGRFQRMHLLNSLSIATLSEPGWRQLLCWRRWCKVAGMFRDAESMGGHWAGINYEGWYIVLACLLSKSLQHH